MQCKPGGRGETTGLRPASKATGPGDPFPFPGRQISWSVCCAEIISLLACSLPCLRPRHPSPPLLPLTLFLSPSPLLLPPAHLRGQDCFSILGFISLGTNSFHPGRDLCASGWYLIHSSNIPPLPHDDLSSFLNSTRFASHIHDSFWISRSKRAHIPGY